MINQIKENIWQMHFIVFGSCVYLVKFPEPILIDVSSKAASQELLEDLEKLKIKSEEIKSIILTHNHYDNIENLNLFPNAKIYSIKNKEEIEKDFPDFKIIKTPGHTQEDICILYKGVLFSGDTIFNKEQTCIGRTDFKESNPEKMQESLEKLKNINYEFLCPGHLI